MSLLHGGLSDEDSEPGGAIVPRMDVSKYEFERDRRGLVDEEVARLSGVHLATIGRAKRGRAITVRSMQAIAKAVADQPVREHAEFLLQRPEGEHPPRSKAPAKAVG